jgi:hypothetical protein
LAILNDLPDVWIISGSNFFPPERSDRSSLVNFPVTWGWATSRNKWEQMRQELLQPPTFSSLRILSKRNFWWVGSKRAHNGYVDAWDLPLAWAMQKRSKYSLLPPVNLVSNIGYSDRASNTFGLKFPLNLQVREMPEVGYVPTPIIRDVEHEKLLIEHVYRINIIRRFSYVFSFFDFVRFAPKRIGSLNSRLNDATKSDYDYL